MKKFLFILCLFPSLLFAATGDLTVKIRPDGWTAEVTTEGFTTGATYAFGYAAKNVPGPSTPYSSVVSQGYDDTFTLGTIPRTVHMTSTIRLPYASKSQPGGTWSGTFVDGESMTCSTSGATAVKVGDQSAGAAIVFKSLTGTPLTTQTWTGGTSGATFVNTSSTITTYTVPTKDERATGTALVTLVALSDYIYADDNTGAGKSGTAPTVTIPAGFITNTGGASQTSNALIAAAVTQASTAAYQPVIGHWAWPPFQKWDSTSKLRLVGFERHAQQGRSIRGAKITVTDTHGHTYTEDITTSGPSYDPTVGDAEPVIEYITAGDFTAPLDQGDTCTANFILYPWVGDETTILDSSTGTAAPTPLVGPITGVNDKAGTYGRTFAVVDASAANDTSGVCVDRASYGSDALAEAACTPYKTIGKALAGIAAYNNTNRSRNTVAAGEVACIAGSYNWLGSTNTYGTTPACWAIVRAATGVASTAVLIAGSSGSAAAGGRIQLKNVSITSGTNNTFGDAAMWLDTSIMNTSTASPNGVLWNNTAQCVWATRISVTAWGNLGFRANSTVNMTWPLVRGCNLNNFVRSIHCYTVLGNSKTTNDVPSSAMLFDNVSGGNAPAATNIIIAYNKFMGYNDSSGEIGTFGALTILPVRGMAMVQNVFEKTGKSGNSLMSIASSEAVSNTPFDNVILWHNTWLGERQNFAYNSTSSTLKYRRFWSVKNNNFADYNIKSDNFTSGDGARIGNWPCYYGVGWSGNMLVKLGNGFENAFSGLSTDSTADWNDDIGFWDYVDYQAALNNVADSGNGDYRLHTTSPAYRIQRDFVLKYGMRGKPRSGNYDSSGAFSEGGVRPASMFFAN